MIYPYELPKNVKSEAEKKVFNQLLTVKDKYDIFFSRRFINRKKYEKKEYEIDFIIANKPKKRAQCHAIFCIEIKGGLIEYDGEMNLWKQNGRKMKKSPDVQASSYAHSLMKRYDLISKDVVIDWALCFPDCDVPDNTQLPTNLAYDKIIDSKSALYLDKKLEAMIEDAKHNYKKTGCNVHAYESFKKDILRGIDFVETLSTKFKYEDKRFVQLTDTQIDFFNHISDNNNILISGYAGTGKTVIAIAAAENKIIEGKTVLFLCYNRTLANKIRYKFDKNNDSIKVATFHSLAKSIIDEKDPNWFKQNYNKDDDEFWSLKVPMKLDSVMDDDLMKWDTIIIDEGQDFKELWFETIFKLSEKDGFKYVFADPLQDIFSRKSVLPNKNTFFNYNLKQNCRNTKRIVSSLSETVEEHIQFHENSPDGEPVTINTFNSKQDLINALKVEITTLIKNHGIKPEQILLMPNSSKNKSSIDSLNKIGKVPVTNLSRSGRFDEGKIHYASINLFKGLEIDILFIIDADKAPDRKTIYTQISRGKNKVYLYSAR